MISVQVRTDQFVKAESMISAVNYGNRGMFDGTRDQQLTGIVAELALYEELKRQGFRVQQNLTEGEDGGLDYILRGIPSDPGIPFDLKTMGRTVDPQDHYVNNFLKAQMRGIAPILCFASLNKMSGLLTVCGFVAKNRILHYLHKKGTVRIRDDGTRFKFEADSFEVPNEALTRIDRWSDFYIMGLVEIKRGVFYQLDTS